MAHELSAPTLTSKAYAYRYALDNSLDLLEAISDFGAVGRKGMGLDEICTTLGLPGKVGNVTGADVGRLFTNGEVKRIAAYNETDALSTYGLFLRYALLVGDLTPDTYAASVTDFLKFVEDRAMEEAHIGEWLAAWATADAFETPALATMH